MPRCLAIALVPIGMLVTRQTQATETTGMTLLLPETLQTDAGYRLAATRVAEALRSRKVAASTVWFKQSAPLPSGDLIVAGQRDDDRAAQHLANSPEAYHIWAKTAGNRRVLRVVGGTRGAMYGLFKLAERIRLGEALWTIQIDTSPAFGLRIFSEEGQLLDIPDRGYYTETPPYVNESLLRQETEELKRLIPHVVALGYNAFALLHLGVEEHIDYRYLDQAVYAPDDPHVARSVVFCKYLSELCDYAHSFHVDVYLQVYEIQFPQRLDELYTIDLDSPNVEAVINARYRELFERVPLDGMIITATETHPRVAYKSKALWRDKGRTGAARMITLYHNACKAMGKACMFRLWRIAADAKATEEVLANIPKDAMLSIKNTGGDFFLNFATTDVISAGLARKQPMTIVFDTFRQYDGWSRMFIYMKRWGDIVRSCRDNGVVGLNAWGPWAEGCIWPDHEPGYLAGDVSVPVSWRGHWASFRMFTRGFTPGQANVYLLGRLGWNPDADTKEIARDFAALHVGEANSGAAAEALLATEGAFVEEYVGRQADVTHPCYIKWTMVFSPREDQLERAYKAVPIQQVLDSNARALGQVQAMMQAFARTDPSKAPNKDQYARFARGIDLTALYIETFFLWRECWWRHRADRDLKGEAKAANAGVLKAAKARLMPLFDEWKRYPEEAGFWRVTFRYGRPSISSAFPNWYPRGDVTMETTAKSFGG
ncbi:MAG: hypothetical protein JXQ75_14380 [Phycisphaerae bacterium]|nr:hypothetical protein [Phycisphaerae bacterium]